MPWRICGKNRPFFDMRVMRGFRDLCRWSFFNIPIPSLKKNRFFLLCLFLSLDSKKHSKECLGKRSNLVNFGGDLGGTGHVFKFQF